MLPAPPPLVASSSAQPRAQAESGAAPAFAAFVPQLSMASLRPLAQLNGRSSGADPKQDRFKMIGRSLSIAGQLAPVVPTPAPHPDNADLNLVTSVSFESDTRLDWVTGDEGDDMLAAKPWALDGSGDAVLQALTTFEAVVAEAEFMRALVSLFQMLADGKCAVFCAVDHTTSQCVLVKSPALALFAGSSTHTRRELTRRGVVFSTPEAGFALAATAATSTTAPPVRDAAATAEAHDEFDRFRKSAQDSAKSSEALAKARIGVEDDRAVLVFSSAMAVRGLREYLFNAWSRPREPKTLRAPVAFPGCTVRLLELTRPVRVASGQPGAVYVTRVAECFCFASQVQALGDAFVARTRAAAAANGQANVTMKVSAHPWSRAFQHAAALTMAAEPAEARRASASTTTGVAADDAGDFF